MLLSMEFARTSGGKFEKEISPSEIIDFNLLHEVKKELGWQLNELLQKREDEAYGG